jgi:hypothetical protein
MKEFVAPRFAGRNHNFIGQSMEQVCHPSDQGFTLDFQQSFVLPHTAAPASGENHTAHFGVSFHPGILPLPDSGGTGNLDLQHRQRTPDQHIRSCATQSRQSFDRPVVAARRTANGRNAVPHDNKD